MRTERLQTSAVGRSSDNTIAGIDSSGFAYAAAAGTVTITGSTGVDSGTATLTVNATQGYTPAVHDSFVGSTGPRPWTQLDRLFRLLRRSLQSSVYQNNPAGRAITLRMCCLQRHIPDGSVRHGHRGGPEPCLLPRRPEFSCAKM